jgi:hypothetical protein
MSFLFGGSKSEVPPVPAPVPAPAAEAEVKEDETKKIRKGAAQSTILTSAQGVLEPAATKKKTLLGAE